MAGQIILYPKDIIVTGGTGSVNTTASNDFQSWEFGGLIRNIFVKAPLSGDTFDFTITNPSGNTVFERRGITTKLSETINFPVRGIHTLTIENASRDGRHTVEMGFEVGRE